MNIVAECLGGIEADGYVKPSAIPYICCLKGVWSSKPLLLFEAYLGEFCAVVAKHLKILLSRYLTRLVDHYKLLP